MKTKIYKWLLKQLKPKYSKEQKHKINQFKAMFKIFFEGGYEFEQIYSSYVNTNSFGITDLKFKFTEVLEVTMVLQRPGLLIGKGGSTIDALNDYLKDFEIQLKNIEESKLWNRIN